MSEQPTKEGVVFTPSEIARLQKLPAAIELVIDGHHVMEAEADAMAGEFQDTQAMIHRSEERRKELETALNLLKVKYGD